MYFLSNNRLRGNDEDAMLNPYSFKNILLENSVFTK